MNGPARMRQLLASDQMVVAPFIMNALHAKIAESVGFDAVYMTGAGTSAERGFPDVGLLTMTEMVANAKYIANAVDIPVICDADTGYGNPSMCSGRSENMSPSAYPPSTWKTSYFRRSAGSSRASKSSRWKSMCKRYGLHWTPAATPTS